MDLLIKFLKTEHKILEEYENGAWIGFNSDIDRIIEKLAECLLVKQKYVYWKIPDLLSLLNSDHFHGKQKKFYKKDK